MSEQDAYLEYVERRRAQVVPEIEVTPSLTEREANLLIDLVTMTAKQVATTEQLAVITAASTKIELALQRAKRG